MSDIKEANLERLTYTVTEAAQLLGISRTTAYECVNTGEIPALRFGKRIVISKKTIEGLIRNSTCNQGI